MMARGSEHYYPSTSTLMDAPELLPDGSEEASEGAEELNELPEVAATQSATQSEVSLDGEGGSWLT